MKLVVSDREANVPTLEVQGSKGLDATMEDASVSGNERASSCYTDVVPIAKTNNKFREFRIGSEFMEELRNPELDTDGEVLHVDSPKDHKMEAAIRNALKMARKCSLQTIGSYEPFDPVDPTTWTNKSERKRKGENGGSLSSRSSSPMVSCYCYVHEEELVAFQKQNEDKALLGVVAQQKKERRSPHRNTAHMPTPYTLEQQDAAYQRRQDDGETKTDTKKERIFRQRSHAPTATSHDKDNKKDRRARLRRHCSSAAIMAPSLSEQQENVHQTREKMARE